MPLLKTNIEYGESIFDDRAVYLTFAGAQARAGRGSVALIAPRGIRLFWQTKFRTQLRTSFYIGNSHYCLPVTDIAFEKLAGDVVKGKWVHLKDLNLVAAGGRILFTVTLGEPFQPEGFREPLCYKLVSGVSVLPPSMA